MQIRADDSPPKKRESTCTHITRALTSAYYASCTSGSRLLGWDYPGIPHLRGNILMGRLSQVGHELGDEMKRAGELAIKHPSGMCYLYIGPNKVLLLITKPEHIHAVMKYDKNGEVTSKASVLKGFLRVFGNNIFISEKEEWNDQRKRYRSFFLDTVALRNVRPEMQNAIDQHIATYLGNQEATEEKNVNRTVELSKFCTDLAMNVIAITRMGTQTLDQYSLDQLQAALAQAMHAVSDYRNSVRITLSEMLANITSNQSLHSGLTLPTEKAKTALQDEFIKQIVNKTHSANILETHNLLRTATAKVANKSFDEMTVEDLKSDRAVCDGSFLLLAGHETTSKLIQFILMELSRNPEMVEKIRTELASIERTDGLHEGLEKLSYLNSVIKEGLRLYTPVPLYAREVLQDFELGDITVRKETVVMISPYVTHQREDVSGPHPEKFNPDRWRDVNGLRLPGAFIAFGNGARSCVGEKFAETEARIAIVALVNNFNFKIEMKPEEDLQIYFETRFEGTLKPAHDVPMTFAPRRG